MELSGVNAANHVNICFPSMGTDSETKALQKQIEEKQKELKELSTKDDIPLEEKMKQRQQLEREINLLESQLRMHQKEVERKNKQEQGTANQLPDSKDRQSLAASISLSAEGMAMSGLTDSSMNEANLP